MVTIRAAARFDVAGPGRTATATASESFHAFRRPFLLPNAINATHVSVTDMEPNLNGDQINLIVNINDVFSIIRGFQGFEYPGTDLTQCP